MAVGRSYLYSAGDDLMIKAWNLHDLTLHKSVDVTMSIIALCVFEYCLFNIHIYIHALDFYSFRM